ncbi:MAG: Trp biosynthesis-associated membrane protein [Microbacterium sp.]
MTLARRGRSSAVCAFLLGGAIGIISSTQPWFIVQRVDAASDIPVPGAAVLPLLAPLSLMVLALGAALAITGRVARFVFGVLAAGVAVLLGWSTVSVVLAQGASDAVAPTVTEITGLAGRGAMDAVIATITPSTWPLIAVAGWVILGIGALIVLVTGGSWTSGGRRYRTDAAARTASAGPIDAVDSWDDLSRGADPTC